MSVPIIDVDVNGLGSDGEEFDLIAASDKVAAGFMKNEPALLRFPDGKTKPGNRMTITPLGMSTLAKLMGRSH